MDTTAAEEHAGVRYSAWLVYLVIVFEIVFMISPAALYYYSVYGLPLNLLADHAATSWLTQYVLPHFTYHTSLVGLVMIMVSWPLIILGLMIFLWGFVQIYYTKFTGGGPVTGGLYRYVRHPQYTGLAIAGLGTTFFWSRFLVLIAYISMMFLYVMLARDEESRCRRLFGAEYEDYLSGTGRFLPRSWTRHIPSIPLSTWHLVILYVATLLLSLGGGWLLKLHVLDKMLVLEDDGLTAVAVAPIEESRAREVMSLLEVPGGDRFIAYIVPASWNIPELGVEGKDGYTQTGAAELAHPTMHGNLPDYDGTKYTVLIAEGEPRRPGLEGLAHTIRILPLFHLHIDVETGEVRRDDELDPGRWAGIPVPVY